MRARWTAVMAMLALGCGAETGTSTGALTIEGTDTEVSGTFVDGSDAELGEVAFQARFVEAQVLEIVLDFHGMTITSLVDFESGVIEHDGFSADNGEDTQMLEDDRALLLAFADALDQLGTDVEVPTLRLRMFVSTWAEYPETVDLQGLALFPEDRWGGTSLCSYVNSYVRATHDCDSTAGDCSNWWGCSRGDDNSTLDYAYLSMHAAGPCSDGTYFNNGSWQCYEPDHSGSIEYAYGNCLGRCGASCGSDTQFTKDCLDHDECVRFGHSTASFWCDDEFTDTVDDWASAQSC